MILPTQFASSSVVEKALNPPLFAIFDLFPTHPPPLLRQQCQKDFFQPVRHLAGSLCFLTGHIRLFGPGELPERLGGGWG